jgi:hypothetical protein
VDRFAALEREAVAAQAGFTGKKLWTDRRGLFALHGLA